MKYSKLQQWLVLLSVILAFTLTQRATAELVGYWPLNGDFTDLSGQGNDGEAVGAPEFDDDVFEAFGGQSLRLNGEDAVLLGNPDILNFGTGDFTISAWAKKDAGGRGNVYSNGGDNGGGIRSVLAIGETGGPDAVVLTLDVNDGDGAKRQSVSTDESDGFPALTATDEEWNHIVGMRAGDESRVYVNGELADIISLREGYDLSGMSQIPSYIGVGASAASDPIGALEKWYVGFIDEVAIWDEALSDEFIVNLAGGAPILEDIENPGDFNMDGQVTLADFLIMADNFNEKFPIAESFAKGDASRDGRIDLSDFIILRAAFGGAGEPAAASVPEPSGVCLAMFGLLALASRRRRPLAP